MGNRKGCIKVYRRKN